MKYQVLHNARCGKSRAAIQYLDEHHIDYEVRAYLKDPLSKLELQQLIKLLGLKPIDLVRTNENEWKDHFKGKDLSDDEIVEAMVAYPKLIQRPIVATSQAAVIARPIEKLIEFLKEN